KRHLAAFEAVDGYAGPGRLALAAATAGLADTRADAAADADAHLVSTGIVAKFVQTGHCSDLCLYSPTTRTRCGILLIMPRTSGVSTSSRCLFILLSPRPIRVARWLFSRRIGEPTCWTTMVFAFAMFLSPACYQASTAASPRRACSSETLRPRREATERGLST